MRGSQLVAGRYRLEQRIAAGGMGEVWRGFDTRLERPVAIKLLHSGMSGNARFRARFQAEAKSVAALQAPGIVNMYDYGEEETAEGLESYLVMELVDGQSLADMLKERGRLSPSDTMRIIGEAGEALDAAHRAGIVHRDVKPGNILISASGQVKIVDFGIARARGEAGLTETGMVMGTVAYTSPEQLCDHELTAATDVYSLGVVAYECLTGATPFASENPGAVINGHMNQPPPPMPGDVPALVSQVIDKSLAKNPQDRWESAAQFAQACREAANGGGTTAVLAAQPPPAATRMMPQNTPARGMAAGSATPQPPREPMPPPRHPEEPEKKSKALPILATLAILAIAAALLVLWSPWNTGQPAAGDETSESQSPSDEGDEDDTGEDTPDEDTPEDTPEESTPQDPTSEEPDTQPMPNLLGEDAVDARDDLYEEGFQNVSLASHIADGDCEVVTQDPGPNTEITLDHPITLYYAGDPTECEQG